MAANVAVAQDPAGNLKPAKDKSTERIDGIVATIMAIGRAMVDQASGARPRGVRLPSARTPRL
jgi:phage terminase large subunit-like protein